MMSAMKDISEGRKCTACERPYDGGMKIGKRAWWNLNGYNGFSGYFCPQCYDMISHDAYNKPKDPEGYLFMLLKFGANA